MFCLVAQDRLYIAVIFWEIVSNTASRVQTVSAIIINSTFLSTSPVLFLRCCRPERLEEDYTSKTSSLFLNQANFYTFDCPSNISSVIIGSEATGGGSHGGDEAELNLDIKHRRSDVRAVARGPRDVRKERRPGSVCRPAVGIPRMLQQCGNRPHPITPEALYPQCAPRLQKTDNLTVLNLFKGLQGSWKVPKEEKLIISASV